MAAKMVDISAKEAIYREAVAVGEIVLKPETLRRIREGRIEKGDPLQIARIAGIQGAKATPALLPLCHPLPLEGSDVRLELLEDRIRVEAKVKAHSKTGVEMEALSAVALALLSLWDVVKAYEKDEEGQYPFTKIEGIRVLRKVKGEDRRG